MSIEKNEHHNILMLAGLGDQGNVKWMELLVKNRWRRHGLDVTVYNVGWKDGSVEFEPKLKAIEGLIEKLAEKGPVSLIGISAGGSAAFNAFLKRPDIINKVINICGRLRSGEHKWRSLKKMSAKSKPFERSVLLFQEQEAEIPEELKKRMMTVSALIGDQLVPSDTSYLEGAYNIKIPTAEHLFSIAMSLTLFSKPIIDFIKLTPEEDAVDKLP